MGHYCRMANATITKCQTQLIKAWEKRGQNDWSYNWRYGREIYERNPCKDKALLQRLPLLSDKVYFTDDTVMTIAIAFALFFGDQELSGVVDKEDWGSQAFLNNLEARKRDPDALTQVIVRKVWLQLKPNRS